MNTAEAKEVLSAHLGRYREWPYDRLVERIGSQDTAEELGPTGVAYQLEFMFEWDDKPGGCVRVLGCVDDGGWRAFKPLCDDFIRAPDGSFVDE